MFSKAKRIEQLEDHIALLEIKLDLFRAFLWVIRPMIRNLEDVYCTRAWANTSRLSTCVEAIRKLVDETLEEVE